MCLTKQWTRLVLSGDSHALERTGMTKASSCMPAQTMTSERAAPVVGSDDDQRRRWWILAVLGIAQLMVVLDATVVNIALPSAQKALHFSNDNRQWISTAYALAFGSLLLLGGRIGDLFGRKRTFVGGAIGFAVASAFGGAAQSFARCGARAAGRVRGAAGACGAVAAHHDVQRPRRAREGVRGLGRAGKRPGCASRTPRCRPVLPSSKLGRDDTTQPPSNDGVNPQPSELGQTTMANHLLHIDSSIQADRSVSRRLTARAAGVWLAAHPGGTVTYRDLGADPLPHLDSDGGLARMVAPAEHTPAQATSWALTTQLVDEVKRADTILLGLPVYNFGAPSTVKAWVDHLVALGLSLDPATHEGLLGGRDLIVLAARGGGYAPGTPREGWDHAEQWLPHGLSITGLTPRFITAELTLADVTPAMAELKPLAAESLAAAETAIDALWETDAIAA
ncbi:MAG: FMN-dependent NADH-azoreductase [Acidimicrobiaceae bacterium]